MLGPWSMHFGKNSEGDDAVATAKKTAPSSSIEILIGLRHCFLDHGAADALAALIVEAAEDDEPNQKSRITLDVALNPVLEEEMVAALAVVVDAKDRRTTPTPKKKPFHFSSSSTQQQQLDSMRMEMAERYMDQWHAIQESKQRAAEARERVRAASQMRTATDPWDTHTMSRRSVEPDYFGDDPQDRDDDEVEDDDDYDDDGNYRGKIRKTKRSMKSNKQSSQSRMRSQEIFLDSEDEDDNDEDSFGAR